MEELRRNAREATDKFFAEKLPLALQGIWGLAERAVDEKVKLAALKKVVDHFQPRSQVPGAHGGQPIQILNYIPLPTPQSVLTDVGPAQVNLPPPLRQLREARRVGPEPQNTKFVKNEPEPSKV